MTCATSCAADHAQAHHALVRLTVPELAALTDCCQPGADNLVSVLSADLDKACAPKTQPLQSLLSLQTGRLQLPTRRQFAGELRKSQAP